jgi:hypothetical protein
MRTTGLRLSSLDSGRPPPSQRGARVDVKPLVGTRLAGTSSFYMPYRENLVAFVGPDRGAAQEGSWSCTEVIQLVIVTLYPKRYPESWPQTGTDAAEPAGAIQSLSETAERVDATPLTEFSGPPRTGPKGDQRIQGSWVERRSLGHGRRREDPLRRRRRRDSAVALTFPDIPRDRRPAHHRLRHDHRERQGLGNRHPVGGGLVIDGTQPFVRRDSGHAAYRDSLDPGGKLGPRHASSLPRPLVALVGRVPAAQQPWRR